MMQRILLVVSLILNSIFCNAQTLSKPPANGDKTLLRESHGMQQVNIRGPGGVHENDLPDTERIRINKRIAANIARLKEEKVLKETDAPASNTLFSYPLVYTGTNCNYLVISNYVDQNPAVGDSLDYACGAITYDGHAGTDFALYPYGWLTMDSEKVYIVAAADGMIIDKADSNYDRDCVRGNQPANYVVLLHADGSSSYYWHMKSGTVTTLPIGTSVTTGTYLGFVGSSGSSTGPHLHFEVHTGNSMSTPLIDPFDTTGGCNYLNSSSWWLNQYPYQYPTLSKVSTHIIPPVFPDCPQDEIPNEQYCFNAGDSIYFYVFGGNSVNDAPNITVKEPNGTLWVTGTGGSGSYLAWYYYWHYDFLPSNAPTGTWTVEASFAGQTCIDTFYVNGPASVAIAANTPTSICSGTPVTFTATPSNAGASFNYLWKKNGITVGSNSSAYTDAALANGDGIKCELTSNATCPYPDSVVSNVITMTVKATPSVPTAGSNSPVCVGNQLDLTAGTLPGVTYHWTGPNAYSSTQQNPVITNFATTNAGTYTVTVTGSNGCSASGTTNVQVGCTITFNLKLFIQGYYKGSSTMTQVLYNEGVDPNPASTNVDTVRVSLVDSTLLAHDPDDNITDADTVATAKGVLQTNGTLSVTFPGSVAGHKCYLMITHRNVLQTWSANTVTISNGGSYNFTASACAAYGCNQVDAYKEGIWSFYSGDLNQDQNIDIYDFPLYDYQSSNFYYGYYVGDLNGDGNVDIYDFPVYDANSGAFIYSVHP